MVPSAVSGDWSSGPETLKDDRLSADVTSMLILLALLTTGYFSAVAWWWRSRKAAAAAGPAMVPGTELPADDQPPATAVGWPPGGTGFTSYVAEGFEALDAYLSEGYAA